MQAGRGRSGHVVESRTHHIGRARETGGAEGVGLAAHALQLVFGDSAQHRRGARADGGDHDEVAQALEKIVDEATRILAGLHDPVDRGEGGCGIARGERVDDLVEERGVRVSEQGDGARIADRDRLGPGGGVGPGDQLIEQ